MQITADFNELCKIVCPHCEKGIAYRYRADSREYVHDQVTGTSHLVHTICWANGLRKKYQNE